MTGPEIMAALTRMRVRHGLTQREVAEAAEVTQAHVSQIENGHQTPRLETLLRYADAVGAELAVARRHGVMPPALPRRLHGVSRRFAQGMRR